MLFPLLYLFFYSVLSKIKKEKVHQNNNEKNRYAIIFPAYKEDDVIIKSVEIFIKQNYNRDLFEVYVASDSMSEATNTCLIDKGIKVINIDNQDRHSKANALNICMKSISENYAGLIILDADNIVDENFLSSVNRYFDNNKVLQLHRTSKNQNNDISMLDTISEEINNSIFRKGHVNIGLSSALIGSGMVFPYLWFKNNVDKLKTFAEDKELELLLINDNIFVDYIDEILVYDEKISSINSYSKQRQRWINTQYQILFANLNGKNLLSKHLNISFINKLFQWMMPPRLILFGGDLIFSIMFLSLLDFEKSWIWIINLILLVLIFIFAVPLNILTQKKLYISLLNLPLLFIVSIKNLVCIKLNMKEFGATKHNNNI